MISLNNIYTSGIINNQMSIPTKLKLFKVYIKPLLTYGCELLDLDPNEVGELKECVSWFIFHDLEISDDILCEGIPSDIDRLLLIN